MLLLTKIWDPQLGNPRGTLLKQAGQNRTGQKCGQYLGTHMKQVDKNRMGPICFAHMGPI